MSRSFIPNRDADLAVYANNMAGKVGIDPTAFALTTAFSTLLTNASQQFQTDLSVASSEATKSPMNVRKKRDSRKNLVALIRQANRIVQGASTVTPEQKMDIGLPVYKTTHTPIHPSHLAPAQQVISVMGRTVRLRLWDAANPDKRGKPASAVGASVFAAVSENAPEDPSAFKFMGNISRTVTDITFPSTVPAGAKVWITSMWYTSKAESSPGADAIGVNLAGSSTIAA